jgi:hypothetical protein
MTKPSEVSAPSVNARGGGSDANCDGSSAPISKHARTQILAAMAIEVDEAWHHAENDLPACMVEPLKRLCAAVDLDFRGGHRLADRDYPIANLIARTVAGEIAGGCAQRAGYASRESSEARGG